MAKHVHNRTSRHRGFTIVELLVVVIILGVLAAVVTPGLQSADPEKVSLAASQVAEALRFARSEAMRTGNIHSVRVQHDNETITVEKTNLAIEPVNAESILYHPVTKQSYTFDVSAGSATRGVEVNDNLDVFQYAGLGRRQRVLFDALGVPIFMKPIAGETYHLTNGHIKLGLDDRQVSVFVQPYTGRVTVQ